MTRKFLTLLPLVALVALTVDCAGKKETTLTIRTAPVERRTIVVQAEATGVIEPINVVEVKSRSSGTSGNQPRPTPPSSTPG